MKQLAFYFEQAYCSGCCTCQIACKDTHNLQTGRVFRKVQEYYGGRCRQQGVVIIPEVYAYWLSLSCNHCRQPVCIKVCPTGAITKRAEDGIVLIDQDRCKGCRRCENSCPYHSIHYDAGSGKAGKCDFCVELLAQGKPPACVAACPLRVLSYGPLAQLQKKYGTINEIDDLPDAAITKPSLVLLPHRHAAARRPKVRRNFREGC